MEGKKRKQTYERKEVPCRMWSDWEVGQLQRGVAELGTDWRLISETILSNRNPNQLKCKYNYLLRSGQVKSAQPSAPPASQKNDTPSFSYFCDFEYL